MKEEEGDVWISLEVTLGKFRTENIVIVVPKRREEASEPISQSIPFASLEKVSIDPAYSKDLSGFK